MTDLKEISADDLVVVLDMGTSQFRAAAGVRCKDESGEDRVELLCVNYEQGQGVKRGAVYNVMSSACVVKKLLLGLENQLNQLCNEGREDEKRLKVKIKKVCVGLNGRSIMTKENPAHRTLGSSQVMVTKEMMDSLFQEASSVKVGDEAEILKVVPQEFLIDDEDELNPEGCMATRISGRYKIVYGEKNLRNNLVLCLQRAGYELADSPLAVDAISKSVLSEEEKKSGCAVLDFGAGTTSVAVYGNGILRDVLVAPYGGNVITKDIASLKLTESRSEMVKVKFGSTLLQKTEEVNLSLGNNQLLNTRFLAEVIESRVDEILFSILKILESNHSFRHINEIVLTGCGSQLQNLAEKVTLLTGVDVRFGLPNYTNVIMEDKVKQQVELSQIIGLLEIAKADECYVVNQDEIEERPKPKPSKPDVKKVNKEKQGQFSLFGNLKEKASKFADKVFADEGGND